MAILIEITCDRCGQLAKVLRSPGTSWSGLCDACEQKERDETRAKHLRERAALTVEERLARIEADLYDLHESINAGPLIDG